MAHPPVNPFFSQHQALHLPAALPESLLDTCRARLRTAVFRPQEETGSSFRFDTSDVHLPELCTFLDEDLLQIRALCGLPSDAQFSGRLKRLDGGGVFPWHRDHRGDRLVGMSVNLSSGRVGGGVFEQRLRWEKDPAVRIASQPGDIHVFDVSDPRLVHRVSPITSGVRIVLAGWWTR